MFLKKGAMPEARRTEGMGGQGVVVNSLNPLFSIGYSVVKRRTAVT